MHSLVMKSHFHTSQHCEFNTVASLRTSVSQGILPALCLLAMVSVIDVGAPLCSATAKSWQALWQVQYPDHYGYEYWWDYNAPEIVAGLEQARQSTGLHRFAWHWSDGNSSMYEADLRSGLVGRVGQDTMRELRRAFVHLPLPSDTDTREDIELTVNIRWQVACWRYGELYWWDYDPQVCEYLNQAVSSNKTLRFCWKRSDGQTMKYLADPVRCVVENLLTGNMRNLRRVLLIDMTLEDR